MTVREIVAALIDPVAEQRYRRVLCREADADGYQRGWAAGRRALLAELAESQAIACGPARAALADPEWRVLEERRWGAGGRARAGDRRPGDFEGGSVEW